MPQRRLTLLTALALLVAVFLAACGGEGGEEAATATASPQAPAATPSATSDAATATPSAPATSEVATPTSEGATPAADATPAASPTPEVDSSPISDREAYNLMNALSVSPVEGPARNAVQRILAAGDQRFVSVLMEMLFARHLRLITVGPDALEYGDALDQLTGQRIGSNYFGWVRWYGATDLEPPPGYVTWRGEVLANIDERFQEFLRDEYPSAIRVEEIVWGGVRVDGIRRSTCPPRSRPRRRPGWGPKSRSSASSSMARRAPTRCASWTGTR